MQRLRVDRDIRPLSEFRANAASFVRELQDTRRPMVLTQRGHSAAVLLDVGEFERMQDELELLRDIRLAEEQIEKGQVVPHEDAKVRLLALTKG